LFQSANVIHPHAAGPETSIERAFERCRAILAACERKEEVRDRYHFIMAPMWGRVMRNEIKNVITAYALSSHGRAIIDLRGHHFQTHGKTTDPEQPNCLKQMWQVFCAMDPHALHSS
jgi:hypothetical protein